MEERERELKALLLIKEAMMAIKCEECRKQAVICMVGIKAPLYVCPACGKAIEEAMECPECEEGDLLELPNGDLRCTACGFVEEKCVGGCSI